MRVVLSICLLLYVLSSQAYSDSAPFTARCSYKQPQSNQLINSHDFRIVKNSMRLHRSHKQQKEQAKQLSKYTVHQALEYYLKNNHDTYNPQERLNALSKTRNTGGKKTKRIIPVNEKIYAYAREYNIPKSAFAQRTMNAYEYQLHKEFVEQLTQAQELKPLYNHAREHTVFLDMVGHSVAFGMEANQDNHAATATYWCDIAWKSLDLAHAVGEGLALGVYNTAAFVGNVVSWSADVGAHPWESAKAVIRGMQKIVSSFGNGIVHVTQFNGFNDPDYRIDIDQELERVINQINDITVYCSDQLAHMPLREKVKHITAFGTELIIPGKAFKVVHNVCSRMKPLAIGLFHALRDEQKAMQVAARVEGVAENITMRFVEGAQEAAGAAKIVLSEAQLLLQAFHVDLMRRLEPEIAALRVMFDNKIKGFGEFANKCLKIDYQHILGMDLSFNAKGMLDFGGFHHDFMGAIEKSNVIKFTNKSMGAGGCYRADILVGEKLFRHKTFFSAEWAREKVIGKVYEAYHEFIRSGRGPILRPDGKYFLSGWTSEGIEIEMFITKKGLIKTAYPVLKK